MNYKIRTALFGLLVILFSCNPSNRLNKMVTEKNRRPVDEQVKIIYPKQQINTPANINFVYDYENLFTQAEELKLDTLVRNFEKSNLISIKITTLPGSMATAEGFEQKNATLLQEWDGVHGNTGMCMVIAIGKALGKSSVQYGAYVSKLISADELATIIDTKFKPSFTAGTYFDGAYDGIAAIMDNIRKNIRF